jgi:hypothetical protein
VGRPLAEGYGAAERVARDMRAHTLKISGSATLGDLARDYAFFSHGAFFVHGKLDSDPVADYVARHPDPDVLAMPVTLPRRLFGGLSHLGRALGPPLDWERTLVLVAHRHWGGLMQHLRCCGWVDRRRRSYGRAVMQVIPVIDVLAVERATILPAPLPTVAVAMFGVDGTNAHVQFIPRVAFPGDVATATHLPLVAETAALGAALLAGHDRPFRFIEDHHAGTQGIVPPAP